MVPDAPGYNDQNSFLKIRPSHGATCEEAIKTSGKKIKRSEVWVGGASGPGHSPGLMIMTALGHHGPGGRGGQRQALLGGATSPPRRSAFKLPIIELGVVTHANNPNTREAEVVRLLQVWGQPGLEREKLSKPETKERLSPLFSQTLLSCSICKAIPLPSARNT